MRIKSVHLSNYKRFTDLTMSDIPVSARLVVLIGPNGCGKSSVFDAFLLKSWAQTRNSQLSGDKGDYYQKDPLNSVSLRFTSELAEKIEIEFYSDAPEADQWPCCVQYTFSLQK